MKNDTIILNDDKIKDIFNKYTIGIYNDIIHFDLLPEEKKEYYVTIIQQGFKKEGEKISSKQILTNIKSLSKHIVNIATSYESIPISNIEFKVLDFYSNYK